MCARERLKKQGSSLDMCGVCGIQLKLMCVFFVLVVVFPLPIHTHIPFQKNQIVCICYLPRTERDRSKLFANFGWSEKVWCPGNPAPQMIEWSGLLWLILRCRHLPQSCQHSKKSDCLHSFSFCVPAPFSLALIVVLAKPPQLFSIWFSRWVQYSWMCLSLLPSLEERRKGTRTTEGSLWRGADRSFPTPH